LKFTKKLLDAAPATFGDPEIVPVFPMFNQDGPVALTL
jgi:hypothetical protein